jgi:hypothetical protein
MAQANFYDGFDLFLGKLKRKELFSFVKLNHGFWEVVADPVSSYAQWMRDFHGSELVEKVVELVRNWHRTDNLFFGVGTQGYDSINDNATLIRAIRSTIGSGVDLYCALCWKRNFIRGRYPEFISAIAKYRVVVVGMSHLGKYGEINKIPDFDHVQINLEDARHLSLIEQKILASYKPDTESVYLFQLGDTTSFYTINKLFPQMPNAFLLDMGRSVDFNLPCVLSPKDKMIANQCIAGFFNFEQQEWLQPGRWVDYPRPKMI